MSNDVVPTVAFSRMRHRANAVKTMPRASSAAMSNTQKWRLCVHSVSLAGVSGAVVRISTVDAEAAKPQRAGMSHDSWSRTIRPVTGMSPPQNTNENITVMTSIGRI